MKSLRTARPDACPLTVDEAYAFLREAGPLLEGSGFGVLVPPWWDKPGARLGVRARFQTSDTVAGQGFLSMDTLVQFDWELALGDEPLTYEEFQRLAALKTPLVQVRGQWVLLQSDQIEAAIAFWEKKRKQAEMSLRDALGLALGADEEVAGLPLQGVETSGWLDELLAQLRAGDHMHELSPPQEFVGQLRPYQMRGDRLHFLREAGPACRRPRTASAPPWRWRVRRRRACGNCERRSRWCGCWIVDVTGLTITTRRAGY